MKKTLNLIKNLVIILILIMLPIILLYVTVRAVSSRETIIKEVIIKEYITEYDSLNVKVTCYRATIKECGNDKGICFDSTKVRKGIVALSPDLFYKHSLKLGDTIQLIGTPLDGYYEVHDKTANMIKNTVDVYVEIGDSLFAERGVIVFKK